MKTVHISPDSMRAMFSRSLSEMYKSEVPLYGNLLDLVADINAQQLCKTPELARSLRQTAQLENLEVERHGAIRLGTAEELANMARLFAVFGMFPVGYYDLSAAGLPVHATAFRPTDSEALAQNPFRVFTSLLRLDLIADEKLRAKASGILACREIFTSRCMELVEKAEEAGGLTESEATQLIAQALETFRWQREATVDVDTYEDLRQSHPLIADVVCFKGPHINHLTPRVLDIDAAHAEMMRRGIGAKKSIEGPPRRATPLLLRQTSFLALEEQINFPGGQPFRGTHTARFGEIEQRGVALTPMGRAMYDEALITAKRAEKQDTPRSQAYSSAFAVFPDDLAALRVRGIAYFQYAPGPAFSEGAAVYSLDVEELISQGLLVAEPITYQDFLPVSAAGIFRSNLRSEDDGIYEAAEARHAFETALGRSVIDEFSLYQKMQEDSLVRSFATLRGCMKAP